MAWVKLPPMTVVFVNVSHVCLLSHCALYHHLGLVIINRYTPCETKTLVKHARRQKFEIQIDLALVARFMLVCLMKIPALKENALVNASIDPSMQLYISQGPSVAKMTNHITSRHANVCQVA